MPRSEAKAEAAKAKSKARYVRGAMERKDDIAIDPSAFLKNFRNKARSYHSVSPAYVTVFIQMKLPNLILERGSKKLYFYGWNRAVPVHTPFPLFPLAFFHTALLPLSSNEKCSRDTKWRNTPASNLLSPSS